MVSAKEVRKKLNCYELIVASISWCLDIDSVTVTDLHAFLEHLIFGLMSKKMTTFRKLLM